nr:immunoglobulin heavy chain junction region [Macaca mulatta]
CVRLAYWGDPLDSW